MNGIIFMWNLKKQTKNKYSYRQSRKVLAAKAWQNWKKLVKGHSFSDTRCIRPEGLI